MSFTQAQCIFTVKHCDLKLHSCLACQSDFVQEFPGLHVLDKLILFHLIKCFCDTGSVKNKCSWRTSESSDRFVRNIHESLSWFLWIYLKEYALWKVIWKVYKAIKFHSYHIYIVQKLEKTIITIIFYTCKIILASGWLFDHSVHHCWKLRYTVTMASDYLAHDSTQVSG